MRAVLMITAAMTLLGLVYLRSTDHQQAAIDQRHWCEMVQEHIDTAGEYGWPDVDNRYSEECK